jgi:hypothetical protein
MEAIRGALDRLKLMAALIHEQLPNPDFSVIARDLDFSKDPWSRGFVVERKTKPILSARTIKEALATETLIRQELEVLDVSHPNFDIATKQFADGRRMQTCRTSRGLITMDVVESPSLLPFIQITWDMVRSKRSYNQRQSAPSGGLNMEEWDKTWLWHPFHLFNQSTCTWFLHSE